MISAAPCLEINSWLVKTCPYLEFIRHTNVACLFDSSIKINNPCEGKHCYSFIDITSINTKGRLHYCLQLQASQHNCANISYPYNGNNEFLAAKLCALINIVAFSMQHLRQNVVNVLINLWIHENLSMLHSDMLLLIFKAGANSLYILAVREVDRLMILYILYIALKLQIF